MIMPLTTLAKSVKAVLPASLAIAIENKTTQAIAKVSAVVPIHMQVKAAHGVQKFKNRILKQAQFPEFIETPIPDVSTLALAEIDLSNPFLFRQQRWQSYFKRLRDEDPVHY